MAVDAGASRGATGTGMEPSALDGRRVLVVDDDAELREVVGAYLAAAGAAVDHAEDSVAALAAAAARPPDLVVLDRMIPGVDGLEVARRLRRASDVPIIMLTALGEAEQRIEGLEVGVDDYLAKPFSPRELVLRAAGLLRRARAAAIDEGDAALGRLRVDAARRTIALDGVELPLTGREYDLLAYLVRRPGRVISRETLLQEVWGWTVGDVSTITVHVRRLREKIEADPASPAIIATVWGVGYRLEPAAVGA
ncbi:response regulator transcription factor [Microcella daejeonensis]|uniref:Response regulator transcription factor n=1 Tax=Microcella daejeonensis TaxID=2994971 RepID=A0A9E8MN77_9MICO|nr:response regulator transcription factor [Microcella daejeonensis]WAB82067.1 response regulator transcription factor [Microcella daejeonensis]WAB84238.1 response regulator transcription factor [Microcella daejeonensis]